MQYLVRVGHLDLHQLKETLDIRKDVYKGINERIPESADIGSFLKELNAIIKKNHIALTSIRPQPPIRGGQLVRIPVQLVCEGPFGSIYSLLRDLEGMKRVVLMDKMVISRSEATQECGLELIMNILEYGKEGIASKGA